MKILYKNISNTNIPESVDQALDKMMYDINKENRPHGLVSLSEHLSSFENLRYLKKEAMSYGAQNYKSADIGNKSFNLTENIFKMCFHESAVF